jgi:hypothetical protein
VGFASEEKKTPLLLDSLDRKKEKRKNKQQ